MKPEQKPAEQAVDRSVRRDHARSTPAPSERARGVTGAGLQDELSRARLAVLRLYVGALATAMVAPGLGRRRAG